MYVKIYQSLHFKYVQLTLCQLYFTKTIKEDKKSKPARPQVYLVTPIMKELLLLMMAEIMTSFQANLSSSKHV
jgi:hypothetical protein